MPDAAGRPDLGAPACVGSPEGRPILEPGAFRPDGRGWLMVVSSWCWLLGCQCDTLCTREKQQCQCDRSCGNSPVSVTHSAQEKNSSVNVTQIMWKQQPCQCDTLHRRKQQCQCDTAYVETTALSE